MESVKAKCSSPILGGANTCNKVVATSGDALHLVRVPLTTIDAEVERAGWLPAFIKVDVEGQDYRALLGARKTLASGAVRLVKFEHNQTEPLQPLLDLFAGMDWAVFALDQTGRVTVDPTILRRNPNLFAAPPHIHQRLRSLEH